MRRALDLARRATGQTRPNPLVGCVIVSAHGVILGEGWHQRAGEPHAEINAIHDAGQRGSALVDSTFYVTLEPCNHHGRTPPCTDALLRSKPRRVVVAMRDPNARAGGGLERLRDAGIEVVEGVLRGEALLLNPGFNTLHMLGRPLVTLKWAMSLDGCTSAADGNSKWITGEAARAEVHRRRSMADALLVGIDTLLRDDSRLGIRGHDQPPGPPLLRIVLDSRLRIPPSASFLRVPDNSRGIVCCIDSAPDAARRVLASTGAEVLALPAGDGGVSIQALLAELARRGVQSLIVEGGRRVAGSFLDAGVVDRVEGWIAPTLIGGGSAHLGPVQLVSLATAPLSQAPRLHHPTSSLHGDDWLLEGWLSNHLFPLA